MNTCNFLKIDSQSSGPSRHEENEFLASRGIELIDIMITLSPGGATVKSAVLPSTKNTTIFHVIEHGRELGENHSPVPFFEHGSENFVDDR